MEPSQDIVDQLLHELEEDEITLSANSVVTRNFWKADSRPAPTCRMERKDSLIARRIHEYPFDDFDRQLLAEQEQVEQTLTHSDGPMWTSINKSEVIPESLVYHPKPVRKLDLSQFAYSPAKKIAETREWSPPKSPHDYSPRKDSKTQQHTLKHHFPAAKKASIHTALNLGHAPPVIQGIQLVPVNYLPERFRGLFSFELFNAVQSKIFEKVYNSNDNIVLSSPTGSGKTIVLELAICRAIENMGQGTYKIVYQAPTKALCAERKRDWQKKFAMLGLTCTELTGDTDHSQLSHVKDGDIIITTPEKWDSMTRRWEDHKRLLQMVKVFLVDEIHTLKDSRGATLEVVISRMKSLGIEVRFLALSATIPNSSDIANWLGKNSAYPNEPAYEARFGEEFRPVKLQKYVYGYQVSGNDFMFDKSLDKHLIDTIKKHSANKAVMIFCMTRTICATTARFLAEAQSKGPHMWPMPKKSFSFKNKDLQSVALLGVGFHHAGVDQDDRLLLERLYLEGVISVICCTSTLALGINMPAYLVVLKNTVTYGDQRTNESRVREYDDLEIMQMLGRAGRPQFDIDGVAVIMTRKESQKKYEMVISGTEPVESCLHLNLLEHLNAEIGMGTISDLASAKLWLKSTFLWHRMKSNPAHYKLQGQTAIMNIDQTLEEICEKDVKALEMENLIEIKDGRVKSTAYGHAMARSYIKFETMKRLLGLRQKAKLSEIFMTVSEASEFKDLRIRQNEKNLYREINKNPALKYPIKGVDVSTSAHKVYLLIQFELGSLEIPPGDVHQRQAISMAGEKNFVFQHLPRIARCLVECRIECKDAITLRNTLELGRCLKAHCWENTPGQLRQLDGIGPATMRKFIAANIRSIEELAKLEQHKIEMIASRHPPFGSQVLKEVSKIPQFTIALREIDRSIQKKKSIKLILQATIGCNNQSRIGSFKGKSMMATFLAECDGEILEFRRIQVYKLQDTKTFKFVVELFTADQSIYCQIACEDIAGTVKSIQFQPDIDRSLFPPPPSSVGQCQSPIPAQASTRRPIALTKAPSQKYTTSVGEMTEGNAEGQQPKLRRLFSSFPPVHTGPEFDEYDDSEFLDAVDDLDFSQIENLPKGANDKAEKNTPINSMLVCTSTGSKVPNEEEVEEDLVQLPNGKWKCKHKCGDKMKCKHYCCREGLDKPPKITRKKIASSAEIRVKALNLELNPGTEVKDSPIERRRDLSHVKEQNSKPMHSQGRFTEVEVIDLANDDMTFGPSTQMARSFRVLNKLHSKIVASKPARTPKMKQTSSATKTDALRSQPDERIQFDCESSDLEDLPPVLSLVGGRDNTQSPLLLTDPIDYVENSVVDLELIVNDASSEMPVEDGMVVVDTIDRTNLTAKNNGKRKAPPFLISSDGETEYIGEDLKANEASGKVANNTIIDHLGGASKRRRTDSATEIFTYLGSEDKCLEDDDWDETLPYVDSSQQAMGASTEPRKRNLPCEPSAALIPSNKDPDNDSIVELDSRWAGISEELFNFLGNCVELE